MDVPEVVFPNLGIEISVLPKIAFSIGPLNIYWYGVCIVLGVIGGTLWAIREAKRVGQKPELYTDFLFYVLIFSLIGARIYYVIFSWDSYKDDWIRVFAIREGGLAIYGGVIAAFATAIVYTRVRNLDFWAFADVCAPGLVLGQAIGRWGNFFNREVFGGFTNSLPAMRYIADQVNVIPQSVMDNAIIVNGTQYIQVVPAFLYESLWNLLVLCFLVLFRKHKKLDGEVIILYLVGYGFGRFFIEGIRTDQLMLFNTGIPVSQLISAILVIGGLIFFFMARMAKAKLSPPSHAKRKRRAKVNKHRNRDRSEEE
ncbi:MAG: prolipoprotein diacylglyceryl transferase [Clostridiales bacterium]|jgi:phosphatidylglycerol:prolipoprotein diacylglycerol transferase|nr:prolipoprotein diacylglyceryl transferase [Clostridiales bacterium]